MVRSSHRIVAVSGYQAIEVVVAQHTGGFFHREPVSGGIAEGVKVDSVERHSIGVGQPAHEILVTFGIARAKMEVAMGDCKGIAGAMHQVQHCHRIASAAYSKQHLLLWREEVLLVDIVAKALQHQRKIILRI